MIVVNCPRAGLRQSGRGFVTPDIRLIPTAVCDERARPRPCVGQYWLAAMSPCLGGYLNRASDGLPGITVVWRGMARPTDIALGYEIARGNNE